MKSIFIFTLMLIMIPFFNINILAQQNKPEYDIKAAFVKLNPEIVTLNNPVSFHYRIENSGKRSVPAKSYNVEFYIDDKLINYDYVSAKLNAKNGIIEYTTKDDSRYIPKKLGKHTYRLVIVPKEILKNENSANNIIEGSFFVIK